jgi:hypothetical protein
MVAERSFDVILVGESLERVACGKLLEFLQTAWESPAIEFKTWSGERSRGYEEDSKSIILKSVSAFLNSSEGRGLLVIGVKGKERFEGVECIPRDERFRSREAVEAFIRETIFSHLKALPDYKVPPLLKVKVFSCREDCGLDQDSWLAAIYIERKADSLYYYSIGGKDRAYIREGGRSRELRIDEMLQIIESKRRALAVIILNPSIDGLWLKLRVYFRNLGAKPTKYLYSLIIIDKHVTVKSESNQRKFAKIIYTDVDAVASENLFGKSWENDEAVAIRFSSSPESLTPALLFPCLDLTPGTVKLKILKDDVKPVMSAKSWSCSRVCISCEYPWLAVNTWASCFL